MIYNLECSGNLQIQYDALHHAFLNHDVKFEPYQHMVSSTFNPDQPDPSKQDLKYLKILLGLHCNYNCLYCNQVPVKEIATPSYKQLDTLFKCIDKVAATYNISKAVELWGGEPLVYWKTIVKLVPYIRKYYPRVPIIIITNGSLLTPEKAQFLVEHHVQVTVSHDGPAQTTTRHGEEVVHTQNFVDAFKILWEGGCFSSFHFVISKYNCNLFDTIQWFDDNVFPGVPISSEGLVSRYSYNTNQFPPFTNEEQAILIECYNKMAQIDNSRLYFVHSRVQSFIKRLNKNMQPFMYGCNDPDKTTLNIDIAGNLLTCHSAPANIALGLGNILRKPNFENKEKAFYSWKQRPYCKDCVCLHDCNGGCGIVAPQEHMNYYCSNKWLQGVCHISGAIGRLFGERLLSISPVNE